MAMGKDNYMSLDDFQNLWSNRIKPSVPAFRGVASKETCEAVIDELT